MKFVAQMRADLDETQFHNFDLAFSVALFSNYTVLRVSSFSWQSFVSLEMARHLLAAVGLPYSTKGSFSLNC